MSAGQISRVTGRRQRPALRVLSIVAWVLAGVGALSASQPFAAAGVLAIAMVSAVPLARIGWLIFRWIQERDWRFVWIAVALLGVIAVAGVIALVGR